MATNENRMKTSFWSFISQNSIKIPIIQRDYAQGRIEKKTIRDGFLNDLKKAIIEGKELKLDYVYGARTSSSFLPLDGQQRLTTLWLLHWFIAFKEKKIESTGISDTREIILNEVGKTLCKFSYETRESSRDFCHKIVEFAANNEFSDGSSNDLKTRIRSNLWFFKYWNHDPTIKAMLTMITSLEQFFKDVQKPLWDVLTGNDCPVVFFSLDLDEYKLTDDLYIKMNARGKALTSFENFKADFIDHLTKMVNENKLDEKYIRPEEGIPIKIDSSWTDIFWKNHSQDYDIDELFFVFINRFLFNEYLVSVSESASTVQNSAIYKYFYGENASGVIDDTLIAYEKFEFYEKVINRKVLSSLACILDKVNSCEYIQRLLENEYLNDDERRDPISAWQLLIPQYRDVEVLDYSSRKIKKVTEIDQRQRPILYAICKYIETGKLTDEEADRKTFHRWMRICKNLIADARLRSIDSMIMIIKKINELSPSSHDIYNHLAFKVNETLGIPQNVLEAQLKEECEKATRIIARPESESTIENIENMAFFKGQIRFIYRDGSGAVDWDDVPRKLETIKQFFSQSGVNSVVFISKFISLLTECTQFLEHLVISLKKSAWIELLLNPNYLGVIHSILLSENIETNDDFVSNLNLESEEYEASRNLIVKAQHEICTKPFLEFLCNAENDNEKNHPRVHCWGTPKFVKVYQNNTKSAQKIYLVGNFRNEVLYNLYKGSIPEDRTNLEPGRVYTNSKVPELTLFRGKAISFLYVSKDGSSQFELSWNENNEIILPDENGDSKLLFSADGIDNSDSFAEKLENTLNNREIQ